MGKKTVPVYFIVAIVYILFQYLFHDSMMRLRQKRHNSYKKRVLCKIIAFIPYWGFLFKRIDSYKKKITKLSVVIRDTFYKFVKNH